jgi:hypothetical protein
MKKTLILLSFFMLASGTASAQWNLGIHAGASYSNLEFYNRLMYPNVVQDRRGGFHAGITPALQWGKKWEFSFPVQYSLKGYTQSTQTDRLNFIAEERLQYIEVSPQLSYRFWGKISVSAGFYTGHLTVKDIAFFGEGWKKPEPDIHNTFDIGITAGFRSYHGRFFAYALWQHGLAQIHSYTEYDINGAPLEQAHSLNRTFQLGGGYYLVWSDK